jgi:hypothetical protein
MDFSESIRLGNCVTFSCEAMAILRPLVPVEDFDVPGIGTAAAPDGDHLDRSRADFIVARLDRMCRWGLYEPSMESVGVSARLPLASVAHVHSERVAVECVAHDL